MIAKVDVLSDLGVSRHVTERIHSEAIPLYRRSAGRVSGRYANALSIVSASASEGW